MGTHGHTNHTKRAAAGGSPRTFLRDIQRIRGRIDRHLVLQTMIDCVPDVMLVLDDKRRIIAANRRLEEVFGTGGDVVLGARFGEAVRCFHAAEGPDACGEAAHCATCGVSLAARMTAESGAVSSMECRLTRGGEEGREALDLEVTATPVHLEDARFTVLAIRDISDRKRRQVLERVFFHDLGNTAAALRGFAEYLAEDAAGRCLPRDDVDRLLRLSSRLLDEIHSQRDLVRAESGDLTIKRSEVAIASFLGEIADLYARQPEAQRRSVVLGETVAGAVRTDPGLLGRILGNMIKNGLEAVEPGGTVRLGATGDAKRVTFVVRNPGVMPQDVRAQIFERSFSTKAGAGRGIGTYSMKLFGERYLGGHVSFASDEATGTAFSITLMRDGTALRKA